MSSTKQAPREAVEVIYVKHLREAGAKIARLEEALERIHAMGMERAWKNYTPITVGYELGAIAGDALGKPLQ